MKRKIPILLGIIGVLFISGCTNNTFSGQLLDSEKETNITYKCPTGDYVNDASECPHICPTGEKVSPPSECPSYCGDGECSSGETYRTCPSDCSLDDFCSGANTIIQGATYENGALGLQVKNSGDVDLSFDVILTFDDGSIFSYKDYYANVGELATFTINDVPITLAEVKIRGEECNTVQDFVGKLWINGLPIPESNETIEENPEDENITDVSPPEPENETDTELPQDVPEGESVKIANWNLQIFGVTKASDDALIQTYASIIDDYDVVFIQEIRDISQTAFPKLCGLLPDYDCVASSRAGRTSSKEQYGVIYRESIEIDDWKDFNPDPQDRWERPPIEVTFNIGGYELIAYNIHTKPDDTPSEIDYLEDVVKTDGNVIVLGDLNADCSYYSPSAEDDFDSWNWFVEDYEDTTVSSTNCAYDRIILNDDSLEEYADYGIYKEGITGDVSDHYLVWVELNL